MGPQQSQVEINLSRVWAIRLGGECGWVEVGGVGVWVLVGRVAGGRWAQQDITVAAVSLKINTTNAAFVPTSQL